LIDFNFDKYGLIKWLFPMTSQNRIISLVHSAPINNFKLANG
jgi:hypothetical protein